MGNSLLFGPALLAGMSIAFLLGLIACRRLLRLDWTPLAVARTVLDEALRMKTATVFILLLALLLSSVPFALDASAPLHYRLQAFLSYSSAATVVLLSLMTVFLACATLGFEIQDRRIFLVAVKPIRRESYLLGKWLGIALLNALLLLAAGAAIYGAANLLARTPAKDEADRRAVEEEVLTARRVVRPRPVEPLERRVDREFLDLQRRDPQQVMVLGEAEVRRQLQEQAEKSWRQVPSQGRESYLFEGLQEAVRLGEPLQLRYKARPSATPPDGRLNLTFEINGRTYPQRALVGAFQSLAVPAELVDEKGHLTLTVLNTGPAPGQTRQSAVSFQGKDELELLYRVGSFGENLLRGLTLLWIKLGFLAMLGLGCAAFLGFPVASLTTLVIFFIAATSSFLLDSLDQYATFEERMTLPALSRGMRFLALTLAKLFSQYGHFSLGDPLVAGRHIEGSQVLACLGLIGLLWTGLCGLLAAAVFRRRELAREQA